jgi:histidinol-phosphate aminotransferase
MLSPSTGEAYEARDRKGKPALARRAGFWPSVIMSTDLPLTPLAASLPASVPFVGPEAQERRRGQVFRARLGANESVFGPSPKAIAAMQTAALEVWKYGDSESYDLRAALAKHHGIAMDQIVVGSGIDGLLGNLVRLMIAPGDVVVSSAGAYPTFAYHVTGFGGQLETVPYRDDYEDPQALIDKARETQAKLIYIANPDNPMGSWHSAERITQMIEALPENCLLVLDEAYIDFAPGGTAPEIDAADPRVIRMRTFSKAYGMAGARVGYAIGAAPLITAFNKIRDHFGMSRISQAGALAALEDQTYLAEIREAVRAARSRITSIAQTNGLIALPSAANFIAVDCGGNGVLARKVLEHLEIRDVFVRMPFVAPQNRCIRISAGRPDDLDILAAVLPGALEAAREEFDKG